MPKEKFNLSDYTQSVLQIAEANKCDVDTAFQYFLANLTTMKEHYKGTPSLNYHELGQQWNKLLNREKIEQKTAARARLARYHKGGSN